MKAIIYTETGGPEVLRLVDRPVPEPGPGEVRVRVVLSAVNPSDWKYRADSADGKPPFPEVVPGQDGSGVVDAVGEGVDELRPGDRVWIWEAAWQRKDGTAQEFVVLPVRQAVRLPEEASFEVGAALGIPALTAHRCLTVAEGTTGRLAPGSLEGRTVLVAGGAGAVGNAAIQLAGWAGATVVATVSGPEKAELARAAGARHVVNYRTGDAAAEIRGVAPGGVDLVVEVAPVVNAELDLAVLAPTGTVAVYAVDGGPAELRLPMGPVATGNLRYQGVLVYTVPEGAKLAAVEDVSAAVAAGALRAGEQAGLPIVRFPLERAADAHAAVEAGAVGKVVIEVGL
ncbi:NADPH:quinone reductase [Streptosporangium carneum]|uniref:NADPH:quinone reductase n=1 Tax=Streptosporangium carneum TaxID=47481 RepID=A0A9W6I0F1_9ACTN|nr:NADPH:quinone reductase [Streptosporangium carneum]GLK09720.1 NADPH:quinone reductase [Streptosporangium carneum]